MVAPLILVRDNNGDLHDQEGHLHNAAGHRIDAQGAVHVLLYLMLLLQVLLYLYVMKHHVNAIIEDDFWQVVKEEKLQEGDFEVESLMSFSGSQWCRSTPDLEHRLTYTSPYQSTGPPEHRSTTPMESTASCNAVKILTHEEFAAKHPHPPSPDEVRIARRADTSIDRHGEFSIDRHLEAAID
ncbi:hypothetical protein F2Q68_00038691 [Brassica cretica]|uniref:Uncharacterized protein n=1 Tax=Brassica cretica TaxID=69181 RepID=A0A8S9MNC9_BRACR|nr:hypothetical protein F2Q68_00038691 [Brassica cretica]